MSVMILISVAFYTILERKILSYIQIRKGPNKVEFMGIIQTFSDAIKLFNKTLVSIELMNFWLSYSSPALTLLMSFLILLLISFNNYSLFDNKHSILMFSILSSMSVCLILMIGWSVNSKYCFVGLIRSVAHMISYEVSFFLIILFIVILSKSYSLTQISETQNMMYFLLGNMMLFTIRLISCLAETNRSPFDFAEGESELVSGFNVEYMGGWFALIFLAEYMTMLILMMITSMLFFGNITKLSPSILLMIFAVSLIWIRSTFPRFQYDMLMNLMWNFFLLLSLVLIILSMSFSFF